jgi:hypothetical protein
MRQEIHCPYCKQLNVRSKGWRSIFNPRNPCLCTVCGTNLGTGQRLLIDAIFGYINWFSLYVFYGFVGAVLMLLPMMFVMTIFGLSDWGRYLSLCIMLMGAVGGIISAERARRRGELIHKHQWWK